MSNGKNSSSASSSSGIGFAGLLAVLFIGLKLCHVIAWSWWWVLMPIIIPAGIIGLILAIAGIVAIYALVK